MSLKTKYSLVLYVAVVLLVGAFSAIVYVQFRAKLLSSLSASTAAHLEHEWQHFAHHEEDVESVHAGASTRGMPLRVWKDGKLVHDLFPAGTRVVEPTTTAVGIQGGKVVGRLVRQHRGHDYVLVGYEDAETTLMYIVALKNVLWLACLVSSLAILPLARFLAGAMLTPFGQLSDATRLIDARGLSFRFAEPGEKDEYGLLVESFNSLLKRLDRSFEHMRRFAVNVSHEVRTPLAVIQGESQMMLRKPRDVSEYQGALEVIVRQTRILKRVITRLLTLAEIERVGREGKRSDIDAVQTARDALRATEALRYREDKEVSLEPATERLIYQGQPELLSSVMNNLLENAIKYSRKHVRVRLAVADRALRFEVEDDGPGIPPAQREEAFLPFFRGALDEKSGCSQGHGLGLSIVKASVDAARGTIELAQSRLGGLSVRVTFPAGPAEA